MNYKTTVVAAVVFVLVGTLLFASIAPYLSEAQAPPPRAKPCPPNSPDGQDGQSNDFLRKGCGPNTREVMPR